VQYEWVEEQARLVKMLHDLREQKEGVLRENTRT
jgi:hypothetical protein